MQSGPAALFFHFILFPSLCQRKPVRSSSIGPGDILVGDGDSILVIKSEDAEELAKAAAAVKVKEEGQLAGIHAGKGFPRPFVDQILEQIGVEYVD